MQYSIVSSIIECDCFLASADGMFPSKENVNYRIWFYLERPTIGYFIKLSAKIYFQSQVKCCIKTFNKALTQDENPSGIFGCPILNFFSVWHRKNLSMLLFLSAFLWNLFLCQDHRHCYVPPHLAQPCYVAQGQALICGLYILNCKIASSRIPTPDLWNQLCLNIVDATMAGSGLLYHMDIFTQLQTL